MTQVVLRKIEGATVVTLPDALLSEIGLEADARVDVQVQHGRLVIAPVTRKTYTLEQLMAQCDLSQPMTPEEREWLDAPRVGIEEI
jgi:antitoxin ChpS